MGVSPSPGLVDLCECSGKRRVSWEQKAQRTPGVSMACSCQDRPTTSRTALCRAGRDTHAVNGFSTSVRRSDRVTENPEAHQPLSRYPQIDHSFNFIYTRITQNTHQNGIQCHPIIYLSCVQCVSITYTENSDQSKVQPQLCKPDLCG